MPLTVDRTRPQHYQDEQGRYWSVSEVRREMFDSYFGIPESVLEPARLRGQLLHTYFWKSLAARAGLCALPPIIEAYAGRCRAIGQWIAKAKAYPVCIEQPSVNRKLGIAGTPDALVRYGEHGILALVDLKTGSPVPTEAAQLHLYKSMENYEGAKKLLDVYVTEEGTYKEVERKQDLIAWAAALSAINLLRWRASLTERRAG